MTRPGPLSGDPLHSAPTGDGVRAGAESFVGRTRELAEVSCLLDTSRLVTLTGATGIGKSRLALELGTRCGRRFRDGAWFVDITQLTGAWLVAPAVAAALGVAEPCGGTVTEALVTRFADRQLLLVLDGYEHVARACAELTEQLLGGCPGVSVLATSREPLGVAREVAWRVPALGLPDPGHAATPHDTVRSEAVRLFVARGRAVQPDLALTAAMAGAITGICRRLDGNPLAIELAAAHLGTSSPAEIVTLSADELSVSNRRGGGVAGCDRSVTAAFAWSYRLLPEPQRGLLRRLSLFPAGCTVDAAQQVCSGGDVTAADVSDLLAELAAASLAVVEPGGDRTRYRLLDAIRTRARRELDEVGETNCYQARHAAWCLALSESAAPELAGPQHRAWRERLGAEHANLRAAVEWALAEGQGELAVRLVVSLTQFWRAGGHVTEGCALLERALTVGHDAPAGLRAEALWGLGFLASLVGGHDRALPAAEEALATARELDDTRGVARALFVLGFLGIITGRAPTAVPPLQEAVGRARQVGDSWCASRSLAALGRAHLLRGEAAEASRRLAEGLELARDVGDEQGTANGLIGSGWVALSEERYADAEASLSEALDLATALADRFAIGVSISLLRSLARRRGTSEAQALLRHSMSLERTAGSPIPVITSQRSLGRAAHAEADPAAAWALLDEAVSPSDQGAAPAAGSDRVAGRVNFEAALEVARDHDDHHAAAYAAFQLGTIARLDGDRAAAASLHHEALQLRNRCGDLPGMADSLEALAGLAADRGDGTAAARLFGAAASIRTANGYPRPREHRPGYDADLATAREQLAQQAFDSAWSEGAEMTPQEAVDAAVRSRRSRTPSMTGWESLTPAQEQTALLAGQGLTNQEIGERLFVSPRTVQTHLSQVYAKLGLSSRQELAWELARRELRDG